MLHYDRFSEREVLENIGTVSEKIWNRENLPLPLFVKEGNKKKEFAKKGKRGAYSKVYPQ